jgi:thiamine biosynthesis protein ThiC
MQTFFLKDSLRAHLSREVAKKIKKNDRIALVLSIGGSLVHVFAVSVEK